MVIIRLLKTIMKTPSTVQKGNMKYIKDKERITAGYCERLGDWIKENAKTYFDKNNEADSWNDFERWPDKPTDRNHLIMNGEICVIDRMWEGRHAYVVCQMRKNGCKDLWLVCYVDDLSRADWKNGYFLIPDLNTLENLTKESTT